MNNGTHHIQHAQAGKMVTEYITNEIQGKNSECIMYNTRRVNFLWNGWKLGGRGNMSNSESYTPPSRYIHDDHVTDQNMEKPKSSETCLILKATYRPQDTYMMIM
jgi:hypothetical protein